MDLKPIRLLLAVTFSIVLAACGGESEFAATTPAADSSPAVTTLAADIPPASTHTPEVLPTFTFTALPTATATTTSTPTATPAPPPADLPDPASVAWQPVVTGLNSPVDLTHAGDGSGRLFVVEQPGRIRIVRDGALEPAPFLDIVSQVGSSGNEQGLLGLAFHPRYSENGFFYVNYTELTGDTVIARFQVSAVNPDQADPASETALMRIPQPYPNHNGGAVVFGPDGYLYLGLGDGGAAGDPQGNAQSLQSLLGKILRIDVDGGDPYAIPPDNPFAAGGGLPEIWAYGLRNPWRLSFDAATGDLFIGDVGQNQWEEIDHLPPNTLGGANFGWDFFEGTHPYDGTLPAGATVIAPIAEYSHAVGGCSITGGFVYRGAGLPEWQGVYLYGDYCTGVVWGLRRDASGAWLNEMLFQNVGRITSFGVDEAGEIYLLDRGGLIYRLAPR